MRAKPFTILICIGVSILLIISATLGDFGKRASADTGTSAITFDSSNAAPPAQQPCPTPVLERRKCPWSPSGYTVEPCGPGFCWDAGPQGALACKQENSVPNSGRNYISDLVCNEGYVAERDPCTNVILRCVRPGAPTVARAPSTGAVALPTSVDLQKLLPELNKWLTDTSAPQSPDQTGAVIATTIGAGLLTLLALSNYLLSNPSFAQQFSRVKATEPNADTRSSTSESQTAASGGTSTARQSAFLGQVSSDTASAPTGTAAQLPTTSDELLNALGEQAIESIPDGKDAVADKLVEQIGEVEKRRRVEEEKKRLEKRVAEKTRAYQDAGNALKQVIDGGGDFAAAQRAWQQTGTELQTAQHDLAQLLKEFPDKQA
jgi:hypothetical protein